MRVTGMMDEDMLEDMDSDSYLVALPLSGDGARSPRRYFEAALKFLYGEDLALYPVPGVHSVSWPSALRQLAIYCRRIEQVDWGVAEVPGTLSSRG